MNTVRARRSWWVIPILLLAFTGVSAATQAPDRLGVHATPRPVPEITFENGDGKPMTLADFRGKLIVLNLWATWCPPCLREMPTLDRLQAELGSERFEVVALSIDRAGPSVVREFFSEEGIEHLALYIDTSARVLLRLDIRGIPTTLVVDAAGREVARLTGEADWATPAMLDYFRGLISGQTEGNGS